MLAKHWGADSYVVCVWAPVLFLVTAFLCCLPGYCADIRALYTADIPTRAGNKLAADVYLPKKEGTYPAILMRTPYDPRLKLSLDLAKQLAADDYAVVVAHCRGRYDSPGEFVPFSFKNESQDGYDTVEWIVKQPWSNGKVATMGASYLGAVQWQLAALKNPHVRTMFVIVAPADQYRDIAYPGGAFALQGQCGWLFMVSRRIDQLSPFVDWTMALKHLPIYSIDEQAGTRLPILRKYMEESRYSAYWQRLYSVDRIYKHVQVPTFLVGGFNDGLVTGTLETFTKLREAVASRGGVEPLPVQALIGPWDHLGALTGLGTKFGDSDYGTASKVDVNDVAHRWFDHWLKDRALVDFQKAPLKYFLGGENAWQETSAWPPPSASEVQYFFHSKGHANTRAGDGTLDRNGPESEPADKYAYDPDKPTPSVMSQHFIFGTGPRDIHEIESREDALVYTSEPLTTDLIVTGNPRIALEISSDAPDTDFCAWLCDVSPDGKSVAIRDGIVRASRFLSTKYDSVLEAGKRYHLEIALGATAYEFKAGQRVRLVISSSNFPAFDRNLNTGRKNWLEITGRVAHQDVFHEKGSASQLLLPVFGSKPVTDPKLEVSKF